MNTAVVAIDARHLHSGIGTYIRTLLEGIAARKTSFEYFVITQPAHQRAVAAITPAEVRAVDAPLYAVRGQWAIPRAIRGSSLYHATQYDLPLLPGRPVVVTIYDLTQLDARFVRNPAARLYAHAMLRLAAHQVRQIVTISEYSKQQIVGVLGVAADKVTVAYIPAAPMATPSDSLQARAVVRSHLAIERPYLLYVGNLKRHKDLPTLFRAFRHLLDHGHGDMELVIAGEDPKGAGELRRSAERLGIAPRARFLGYVPRELLPSLYAASAIFVLPSLNEGFGLPVMEAMSCGAPVVCARSSSLPEVGGEAAEYFSPGEDEELAAVLDRLLADDARRQAMTCRGREQARRFSREDFVQRHCDVYRAVLDTAKSE